MNPQNSIKIFYWIAEHGVYAFNANARETEAGG